MAKSVVTVRILGDAKGLTDALGEASSKLGDFAAGAGGLLKTGLIGAGAAAAAGLGKGFVDALDAQALDGMIAGRLGVGPEQAAQIGDAAAAAYRGAWGDTLEDTVNTATALASSFEGLSGTDLTRLIGQAEAIGTTFGVDVDQAIQTTSELLQSGLVGSADEAFDLLTRGLQEMPQAIRDELLAASNEYGDFFGDLGLSGEEAFAAMTKYAEGGVYGIDKFGDALKELTIRGTDMSATSVAAYEAAGLSAEEMSAMFAAGGEQAREALDKTAAGLLSIEDPVARANAAIGLFGTPLEDLSVSEIPGFLQGLVDMGDGLGGVEGAAQEMADTVGGNTQAKLEAFKRQALGALADFAAKELLPRFEQLVGWFEQNWPAIQAAIRSTVDWLQMYVLPVVQSVVSALVAAFGAVVEWVRTNWPAIKSVVEGVVGWIAENVVPVVEEVVGFVVDLFAGLAEWTRTHWDDIRATVDTVLDAIVALWERFGGTIIEYVTTRWDMVKAVVSGAMEAVKGVIETVMALIRGDWSAAWDGIKKVIDGVWTAIKGVVTGAITAMKATLEGAWLAISGVASAAWDGIKGTVSGAIDSAVGAVADLPRRLVGLGGSLLEAGKHVGSSILRGIGEALGSVAGFAGDVGKAVLSAVKNVLNTQVIDRINRALEFTIPVPFIDDIKVNPPDIPRLHSGGWIPGPGVGAAGEVPIIAQTGEYMLSRDDVAEILTGRAGGPLIGVVNVADGRGLVRELHRAQALQAALAA